MKTGSFVLPRLLSSELVQKVAGGVNPNFNYQPAPYQTTISGTGSANIHGGYNYNVNVQVTPQNITNLSINASVSGNNYQAISDGSIMFSIGL